MEPWRLGTWMLGTWKRSESCVVLMEHANVLMEHAYVLTGHANVLMGHAKQNYDALMVRARKFLSGYFAQHDSVLLVIAGLARN